MSNSQTCFREISLVFGLTVSDRFFLDFSELDMVGAGREAKRRRKTQGIFFTIPTFYFLKFEAQTHDFISANIMPSLFVL